MQPPLCSHLSAPSAKGVERKHGEIQSVGHAGHIRESPGRVRLTKCLENACCNEKNRKFDHKKTLPVRCKATLAVHPGPSATSIAGQ